MDLLLEKENRLKVIPVVKSFLLDKIAYHTTGMHCITVQYPLSADLRQALAAAGSSLETVAPYRRRRPLPPPPPHPTESTSVFWTESGPESAARPTKTNFRIPPISSLETTMTTMEMARRPRFEMICNFLNRLHSTIF